MTGCGRLQSFSGAGSRVSGNFTVVISTDGTRDVCLWTIATILRVLDTEYNVDLEWLLFTSDNKQKNINE